jgi:hypothetical protein
MAGQSIEVEIWWNPKWALAENLAFQDISKLTTGLEHLRFAAIGSRLGGDHDVEFGAEVVDESGLLRPNSKGPHESPNSRVALMGMRWHE